MSELTDWIYIDSCIYHVSAVVIVDVGVGVAVAVAVVVVVVVAFDM